MKPFTIAQSFFKNQNLPPCAFSRGQVPPTAKFRQRPSPVALHLQTEAKVVDEENIAAGFILVDCSVEKLLL